VFSQFLEDNRKKSQIDNFWKELGVEKKDNDLLWSILGYYFLNLNKNLPFDTEDLKDFIKITDRYNNHFNR
jgi:hypothetical protein